MKQQQQVCEGKSNKAKNINILYDNIGSKVEKFARFTQLLGNTFIMYF